MLSQIVKLKFQLIFSVLVDYQDMADTSSSSSLSISSIPARSRDPAWQYGIAVEGHRSSIICVICNKTIRGGGITRLKYHLAGIEGNVKACKKVSDDVKWQMKQLINSLNKKQEQRKRLRNEIGGSSSASVNDREEPVMGIPSSTLGGSSNLNARCSSQSESKAKPQSFFPPRTTQGAQPGIRSALATKESVHNATMAMARWWYDANIPFNAAKSNYYQPMVDAITSIGPGFKAPSYHDLSPSFTKQKEVARGLLTTITRLVPDDDVQDKISAQLEEYKASTGDFGLSIAIRQREKLNPVSLCASRHGKIIVFYLLIGIQNSSRQQNMSTMTLRALLEAYTPNASTRYATPLHLLPSSPLRSTTTGTST
ncbi:hypothetical protein ZIOFF_005987 [Zingiber officinale]|uniref:BED-type domain-containing protein n=1 Tax=Zingiber officinale TaxID=94328 RepID=A0A8J5HWX8_ZINOF|nr:hypothetical protein ZIOFF_005987 [Zingiber officinale]